jgi:ADP-ribose pyrophosphatase YjhB (NUDIX family)
MTDLQLAGINTAGAYVCIDGLYPFAIGIRPHNGKIPIVRLGGHREEHETGWQCAVREVYEETRLAIRPVTPQTTYLLDWDDIDAQAQEIAWQHDIELEPVPLLVVTYCRENKTTLSLMYLAQAEGTPVPSSEVKGLLLLDPQEISRLCNEPQTLKGYLSRGGRAILKAEFDMHLFLEPFAQLRFLSRLLHVQSELNRA